MYSDFHIHTRFSGDSEASVTGQIEAAAALGMTELCITDHHDYDVDSGDTDFNLDIVSYLAALKAMQQQYQNRIRLRIGIEFGQQPHLLDYEKDFFALYNFDFVIGSTHFVKGLDPYYPSYFDGRTEREAYEDYFAALSDNLKQFQEYDTAAHLDYVVRYGPDKNKFYSYAVYQDYLDEILKTLIHRGKALECNTAGLKKGLGEPNPSIEVLMRYRELGGELLTLGSDAHDCHNIGYGFEQIGIALKQCGFTYYNTFANRKPVFHKL